MAPPLLLTFVVSLMSPQPSSTLLAWVCGIVFIGLTINRFVR